MNVGISAIANTRSSFTQYSLNQIVASGETRALKVVEAAGGTVTATEIEIPVQEPKAPALEQWKIDAAIKRVEFTDPARTFRGQFSDASLKSGGGRVQFTIYFSWGCP